MYIGIRGATQNFPKFECRAKTACSTVVGLYVSRAVPFVNQSAKWRCAVLTCVFFLCIFLTSCKCCFAIAPTCQNYLLITRRGGKVKCILLFGSILLKLLNLLKSINHVCVCVCVCVYSLHAYVCTQTNKQTNKQTHQHMI
jgi:hypothetical protein